MKSPDKIIVFDDLTDEIKLCFVNIPLIAEYFFLDVDISKLSVLPNLVPDEDNLNKYFAQSEIEKILSFKTLKRQVEKMSGSIALKFLIKKYIGSQNNTLYGNVLDFEKEQQVFSSIVTSNYESGCPFVVGVEEFSVSVSHSFDMAVAALSLNPKVNVGVDLEFLRSFEIENILKVVFSNRERDFYKDKSVEEVMRAFCFKEAYLKYIRKGFSENPSSVELIDGDVFFKKELVLDVQWVFRSIGAGYVLGAVWG